MDKKLRDLEEKIKIKFNNSEFLKEALTHRSYLNEEPKWGLPSNERLEYLGDAVLELIVSEALFKKFPSFPEGQLTVLRAALVNSQMLSRVGTEFGLEKFVLMSKGEAKDIGKAREVILANTIEALIGAMYLDQGLAKTENFIKKFILSHLGGVLETKSYKDSKSELQEIIQEKLKITPTYKVLEETGPANRRTFRIGVYFDDKLVAEGSGASKQEGELEAAKRALKISKNK